MLDQTSVSDAQKTWERMVNDAGSTARQSVAASLSTIGNEVAEKINSALGPATDNAAGLIVNEAVANMITEITRKVSQLADEMAVNKLIKTVTKIAAGNDQEKAA